ncbi:MAG TPA: S-adenosylmethionine decarboxylase [Methanospirillum sp.]|uniref:S-adenosylmethionine decarboxylase n=1 Tax=Methanospirillum sp. TaxID=45200 RepID=UPI002BC76D48|nr:S-adenosylmethionine decarboxylase [Methanospirillum sp.]HOJ97602.1 S-adenosylmethionine decarboxylase [Methanospirillum sp.]HPP76871.1 S-adenosylmethionine decarboxylase [Methanospirillum sp.]
MDSWGIETIIDLYDCNGAIIRDPERIKEYSRKLVDILRMIPYGDPVVVHFGKDDKIGYTLVQLIETSNITAHFAEDTNSAFINIFSCKDYDVDEAVTFTREFFGAQRVTYVVENRGIFD